MSAEPADKTPHKYMVYNGYVAIYMTFSSCAVIWRPELRSAETGVTVFKLAGDNYPRPNLANIDHISR